MRCLTQASQQLIGYWLSLMYKTAVHQILAYWLTGYWLMHPYFFSFGGGGGPFPLVACVRHSPHTSSSHTMTDWKWLAGCQHEHCKALLYWHYDATSWSSMTVRLPRQWCTGNLKKNSPMFRHTGTRSCPWEPPARVLGVLVLMNIQSQAKLITWQTLLGEQTITDKYFKA